MSTQSNLTDEELNLGELFSVIWAHKILIAIITGLSIFYAGYKVLSAEKKFTATASFAINQDDSGGFSLPNELGALASLAGITKGASSNSEVLLERLKKREFILLASKALSLENDRYFNAYSPKQQDPQWKATIKNLIGWQTTIATKKAVVESNLIANFNKNVKAGMMESGIISIAVTHKEPELAANYANSIMEQIRNLIESEDAMAQELRLSYLSETLADALQEMETAQKNLKEYALKNSAMARENFMSGSLKLDELRMERIEAKEISDVLVVIENLIKKSNLNKTAYEDLRKSYPIVDDVKFRRILGMSETISAWSWPDTDTNKAVSATLKDRIRRLDIEIKNIESNAKIYATSAEDLAKLTRDSKIAEATYKVLIEQVKSQSLVAGFKPDTFKVFAYATAPLSPSSPKRNLALALGAVIGFLIGCTLAILSAFFHGVYYTRLSLSSHATADLLVRSNPLRKISRMHSQKILSYLSKRRVMEIDEIQVALANSKLIFVKNLGGRSTAAGIAKLLANCSSFSGRKVLLCDTAGLAVKEVEGKATNDDLGLSIASSDTGIDILLGYDTNNGITFFTAADFKNKIERLLEKYDQIFVCSSKEQGTAGLMALKQFNPKLVLLARLRKTRKVDLQKIKGIQPIGILLHD